MNMIDWCSQLVRQVTKGEHFTTLLDEKKHAFQSTFQDSQLMFDQWRQKSKMQIWEIHSN